MIHIYSRNSSGLHVSEWVDMGHGVSARRYSIIGSETVCYDAYRFVSPTFPSLPWPYSTVHHRVDYADPEGHVAKDWGYFGDLTTEELPDDMDKLLPPRSAIRAQLVGAWHDSLEQQAEAIVRMAFPEDFAKGFVDVVPCSHCGNAAQRDEEASVQLCAACFEQAEMLAEMQTRPGKERVL